MLLTPKVLTSSLVHPTHKTPCNRKAATCRQRRALCQAQADAAQSVSSPGNPLLMAAVESLFRFPPFFSMAAKNARSMIVKRAESIGLDWDSAMRERQQQDWQSLMRQVSNPNVQYPAYYEQPFHAYPSGNLCMEAALEVTMAAKSVHALVMDPAGKTLDPEGDENMRSSYGARMLECMSELDVDAASLKDAVDMGCATGLSSLALLRTMPNAETRVTGVDLSPHFLAVGTWEQQRREETKAPGSPAEPLHFIHAAAEDTGLPSSSYDLVSVCLVCHELPQAASKAVFAEAHRLLRPGGCLSIMEMNPRSPAFGRIMGNPFAYTAFKSTEPWLQEYITLDMHAAIQEVGFGRPVEKECTPRHRTVVAVKH
ncbi:S-adenosyl-L-methionine-dependent methyltransferase [Dunaliella salina]|uniref:S-adenosyl-L-methionine-dependent methyltransferase n=1 Tax=Dunaliella salina TaxID=3046 RepID=A0ABQ7G3I3_DUNSA|nr:S-adenosyl-L-methionine-dependent methyltransferase [Dunaliella salina]|eukprot:KAF5829160.1 S-adenosyl-L-methionine-dependent methyltransferase [Dunaliella salina]